MKSLVLSTILMLVQLGPRAAEAQVDDFSANNGLPQRVEKLEADVHRLRRAIDRLTQSSPGGQAASGQPPRSSSVQMQHARIAAALDSPTEIEFEQVPLADIAHYLSELHDIPVILAPRVMEDGFDRDVPLEITVSNVTLRSALHLMLTPHGLDYLVEDEVLKITTAEAAEEHRETHVYDVRHMQDLSAEELARVIRSTVRPDSWREPSFAATTGGGGFPSGPSAGFPQTESTASIEPLGQFLVIRQSQRGHREIEQLLWDLSRMRSSLPQHGSTDKSVDNSKPTDEVIPRDQTDNGGD